jgi:hypothetical protein
VRRRVRTSVVAGATLEAEIGEIEDVALLKEAATLHRREDSAVALAIATGVADLELTVGLL